MRLRRTPTGMSTALPARASGMLGKSSRGSPAILNSTLSHLIRAQASPSTLTLTSLSGSERTIS